jgi:hypothetical protein
MRSEELKKHTINLFDGDYEYLQGQYPDLGAGPIIRRIVRAFVEQIEGGAEGFNPEVKVNI